VTAPTGYSKATTQSATIWYETPDEVWVGKAIALVRPLPAAGKLVGDLADRIATNKATLVTALKNDLAWADEKAVGALVDDVVAQVRKADTMQPKFFYVAATAEKLKAMVKAGWGGAQFSYNRADDSVSYNGNYQAPFEAPADETIVWVPLDAKDTDEQKAARLASKVMEQEVARINFVANNAQQRLVRALTAGIRERVVTPLGLKLDQQWLGMGIEGYCTAKYFAGIVGANFGQVLQQFARVPENSGVNPDRIDLLKPTPPDSLRDELVQPYEAAMRARSTEVMAAWLANKGDDALARTLTAVRTKKPADGAALVALIKDTTAANLGPDLGPRP